MKFIVLRPNRTGLKFLFCLLITFLLFFGTSVSTANAEVTGWEVNPEHPKNGDTLLISGFASPEEEVEVSISFEKTVPVYLREYTYEFENIEFLNFNNLFIIKAEGVESLKTKIKMVIPKTERAWADSGIATVSYAGIPPGEYRVRVDGMAEDGASGVNLRVTTVQRLKAGEDGKFSYRYNTMPMPSGKLEIKLGDSEREIIFDTKENTPALQTSAVSQIQVSGESEDKKTSERMVYAGKGSTDTEFVDRENEEKHSIYLTENSWDESNTIAATAGKPSREGSAEDQENQKNANQFINFYFLAGVLTGCGSLLIFRRKK